jgi:hypothetical protein
MLSASMLLVGPHGDFSATLPGGVAVGCAKGASWRYTLSDALALAPRLDGVCALSPDGTISRFDPRSSHALWTVPLAAGPLVCAVSSDGEWVFDGERLRSRAGAVVALDRMDFFERWTFARFLASGDLALGFETGQPWTDDGSYGDRYGGVQVHERARGWRCSALEFDSRGFDEAFVARDVCWADRRVFACSAERTLTVTALVAPRAEAISLYAPQRDHELERVASFDRWGDYRALAVDPRGRWLAAVFLLDEGAVSREVVTVFDLVERRGAQLDEGAASLAFHQQILCGIHPDGERWERPLDALPWGSLELWWDP